MSRDKRPQDMSMEELAQAHREVGDQFYPLNDEMHARCDAAMDRYEAEQNGGR